jgi:simple sugar transport system ATP-binding protein
VLGENGAGKSTLMKIIYGVTRQTEGEMFWEGGPSRPPIRRTARALGIGMVFQHFSLFETLTVVENVALALAGRPDLGLPVAPHRKVSEKYGLPVDPRRLVHALSVGERQRVEIIRCLLQNPKLLIMDEPTSGADAAGRAQALRNAAPARGRGLQHSLHQPQAGRNPGALPYGDGLARRQGHRHVHAGAGDAEIDGADDDRQGPAGAAPRRPAEGGEVRLRLAGLSHASDDPFGIDLKTFTSTCIPARSSASPACPATASRS